MPVSVKLVFNLNNTMYIMFIMVAKPPLRSWRKAAPKVEKPLKNVTVTDGEPATLECSISGEYKYSI